MPITVETVEVVYTLEELQDLDWSAHAKAIEAVTQYVNDDYYYIEMISEQLQYDFEEEKALSSVKITGWDYYRPWENNFTADLDIETFMRQRKMHTKYVAFWYALAHLGCFERYISIDAKRLNQLDHALTDFEGYLDRYTDLYDEDRKRYDRILAQVQEVGAAISSYVSDLLGQMQKTVRAEIEYRWSEEFAKEEAEALELHFTEEGKIVHI